MTSRERMIAALSRREPDCVPICEEIWPTTRRRWVGEGLPPDVPFDRFLGIDEFILLTPDCSFGLPRKVIEETQGYRIERDANGATVKNWENAASTPEILDTSINTRETWIENKGRMVFTSDRINIAEFRERYDEARQRDQFVRFGMQFGYERWAGIVGTETYLLALAAEPEWIREMHDADVAMTIATYEELAAHGLSPDAMRYSCDMGYRGGLLFSPNAYREIFMPGLKMLCTCFREKGVFNILHSCGNVNELVPDILATGFDCLNPLEVKAGMDLPEMKKRWGNQLCLMGGIDARLMSAEPGVIEREIKSKVTCAKAGGGYIFHSDHTVPDNVSLDQYRNIVRLARHYGKRG